MRCPTCEEVRNEELETLLERVPQQIFVLGPDFHVEYANRAVLDYHGPALTAVLFSHDVAERDRALHHPDDLPRLVAETLAIAPLGMPGETEARLLGADGSYRWFLMRLNPLRDADGRVVRWYGTRTDIDTLKRVEERLRDEELQLRTAVDLVPHQLVVLDPAGRLVSVNRAALDYTGLTLDALVAHEDVWPALVHPDDLATVRAMLRAMGEGVGGEVEIRLRSRDGQYRWILARSAALRDGAGRIVRWFATGTDIDARKRTEERVRAENLALREEVDEASMFEEIVGSSTAMRALVASIESVAATDSTVLVTGETGTGKELVARAIHKRSARAARAFVSVNCAAIPPGLIASELFGHERGAFTGALQRRLGRFELASGGTIFLDEIGDLSPELQLALLRVLQEREIERVGSTRPVKVDVRVVAATNRDLAAAMSTG